MVIIVMTRMDYILSVDADDRMSVTILNELNWDRQPFFSDHSFKNMQSRSVSVASGSINEFDPHSRNLLLYGNNRVTGTHEQLFGRQNYKGKIKATNEISIGLFEIQAIYNA
jgi:hypothetical protein